MIAIKFLSPPTAFLLLVCFSLSEEKTAGTRATIRRGGDRGHGVRQQSVMSAPSSSIESSRRSLQEVYNYPPRITVVEGLPAKKSYTLMALPSSPWCQGKPTFWPSGHENGDTPWCQKSSGTWEQENRARMDRTDPLNAADPGPNNHTGIDRHGCTELWLPPSKTDATGSQQRLFVVCVVGSNDGKGKGFAELYETRESDGSLRKILHHGLQKYPTMRSKYVTTLRGGDDGETRQYVFVSVRGGARDDGGYNDHTMFRVLEPFEPPYFEQVYSFPYYQNWRCECTYAADVNRDGLDDLILCSAGGSRYEAQIFLQQRDGSWVAAFDDSSVEEIYNNNLKGWQSVRVGSILGDARRAQQQDLVVVGAHTEKDNKQRKIKHHYVRVFRGIDEMPFFDFSHPAFHLGLPYEAPDVEILDVNGDGNADLYVVQDNTTDPASYCGYRDGKFNNPKFAWGGKRQNPPPDWLPPMDATPDLLLLGTTSTTQQGDEGTVEAHDFIKVNMLHSFPGCGSRVLRFGDGQTMFLAQSDSKHAGFSLLLEW